MAVDHGMTLLSLLDEHVVQAFPLLFQKLPIRFVLAHMLIEQA